ncbi:hypothetical protein ACGFZR_14990 [Streptomyces sp. NPDC048241]|uniref:hypothetical protein n=1 Tax=Streptomyces sp. NPDC048241 TaxID=3365521 RepID=UPI00371AA819
MSDEELAQGGSGEPEKDRWSKVEHLLAVVADRVAQVEYVLLCANTDSKHKRPKPPDPIPRPGSKPARPKPTLSEGAANTLLQLLQGGAE